MSAPAPAAASAPANGGAWIGGFCGSLAGLNELDAFAKQQPQIQEGDVAGGRKVIDAVFAKAVPALESAVSGLSALEAAPVAAGDDAKKKLLEAFTPARDQMKAAKEKLDTAPKTDRQALGAAGTSFMNLQTTLAGVDDPMKDIRANPELAALAKDAPSCQKLQS